MSSQDSHVLPFPGSGHALYGREDETTGSNPAYRHHVVGGSSRRVGLMEGSPPRKLSINDIENVPSSASNNSLLSRDQKRRRNTLSAIRSRLGLAPEAPIVKGHNAHQHLAWASVRAVLREPFAEFLGTFVLILFGDGSIAQVVLSTALRAPGTPGYGAYQSISWGWAIGIMLGIYVAGDSGGFLNPAVTFGFCLFRKFPWRRLPIYVFAQLLGAFCASGVVYANYVTAIDQVNGHGIRTVPPAEGATGGIFCTYPAPFVTKAAQFFSESLASAILMFVVFALKDSSNAPGAGKFFPLGVFFLMFGIGACFGWETGYAINLARDFGPRLMSYLLGYGHEVWSAGGYYFWIPMVAPFCGCAVGGFLYDCLIYTGPESPLNKPWFGVWRRSAKRDMAEGEV